MTNPFPPPLPGIRRIPDPQAEMERLAEARKDQPGRDWGVRHPDGKVTVRIDGHAFRSRREADAERAVCDSECDSCDGGTHYLAWRAVQGWQAE